jgi:uncharacterized protein RhaS with RHS repeats
MRKDGANYLLSDHLGGTSTVTDEDGTVVSTTKYCPFGLTREQSGTLAP